ncbi:hypothetical protein KDK82_6023 [Delftia sp. K82]|jgi:hypothetical protein|uniref:ArdC-like ssDNA-binding domain-containing protein n=1 Tax=Delftia sp. K82 TaxID=1472718 RepID=UPI000B63B97E|nr:ArdC-like ssDNA-binding domain-containing protein [Delftia sp. K82]OWG12596.1 hypothetical protein KDK82_6023 [Delftia sp. K82]
METKTPEPWRPDWSKLFDSILTDPGVLGTYYSAFHEYSLGNQVLAMMQLVDRGLPISPISSFHAWKEKGRKVAKGQKALGLWMPVTVKGDKARGDAKDGDADATSETGSKRIFVIRNNWFAYSQTEPDERGDCPSYSPPETPVCGWDKAQALAALEVTEVPFEMVSGNTQGFARPSSKEVSISPLAKLPHKTLFHELAHCILHAKDAEFACLFELDKSIREAEAEATAFLCCSALGLPGLEEARGYVQAWLGSGSTREAFKKSASRVFTAANRILKAGAFEHEPGVMSPASSPAPMQHAADPSGQCLLFV